MDKSLRLTAAALAAIAFAPILAHAQGHGDALKCVGIKNDKDRLACFDKATATATAPTSAAEKTTVMRARYAHALWHTFLERGIDIKVFGEEHRDRSIGALEDAFPVYPRLTLFGQINAPAAYQIVTAMNLLGDAKKYGFAGIRIFAAGNEGFFDFDISKDRLPNCDKSGRVCLH